MAPCVALVASRQAIQDTTNKATYLVLRKGLDRHFLAKRSKWIRQTPSRPKPASWDGRAHFQVAGGSFFLFLFFSSWRGSFTVNPLIFIEEISGLNVYFF